MTSAAPPEARVAGDDRLRVFAALQHRDAQIRPRLGRRQRGQGAQQAQAVLSDPGAPVVDHPRVKGQAHAQAASSSDPRRLGHGGGRQRGQAGARAAAVAQAQVQAAIEAGLAGQVPAHDARPAGRRTPGAGGT